MTQLSIKILVTTLLLSVNAQIFAATLSSRIDRNPIKLNQTLTLIVQYDDQLNSSDLDLSGLTDDFEILANVPSSNNSVSIINGQTTRQNTTTWRITLAAKKQGNLQIPSFNINGATSAPIDVQVLNLTEEELATPQPIEVNLTIEDADNLSIKPGEQIIMNVELSAAANVGNLRGEELLIDGVDIEPLGQQNGQRLENGVARQVAVWRYAIFPTKSGQIDIPIQTFTGSIGGRSSFFDSFISGGQQVGGRSVAQTINVDAQPSTNGKTWFPANNVEITSSWSGNINQVRVGEPVTRTITITADGQRANAIPPLNTSTQNNYKSYKDQPQLNTSTSQSGVIGVRTESEAIVPSASGELILAEQRISWWDNQTEQWQEAILPEETLTVLASVGGSPTLQNTQNSDLKPDVDLTQSTVANRTESPSNWTDWFWKLATGLLAMLCLIQFYLLRRQPLTESKTITPTNDHGLNEKVTWNQLIQNLKTGEPRLLRNQILNWAQSAVPKQTIVSLDAVSNLSKSAQLKTELNKLDKFIYSNGEAIDLDQLSLQLKQLREEFKDLNNLQNNTSDVLAPLYPA